MEEHPNNAEEEKTEQDSVTMNGKPFKLDLQTKKIQSALFDKEKTK